MRRIMLLIVLFCLVAFVMPTSSAAPTYSEILNSYPKDAALCSTDAELVKVDSDGALLSGKIEATGGKFSLKVETGTMKIVGAGKSGGLIYKNSVNGTFRVGPIIDKKGESTGRFCFQCYGTKLTVKRRVTLGGKTYEPGTKLTVDKNLKWIAVSNWN